MRRQDVQIVWEAIGSSTDIEVEQRGSRIARKFAPDDLTMPDARSRPAISHPHWPIKYRALGFENHSQRIGWMWRSQTREAWLEGCGFKHRKMYMLRYVTHLACVKDIQPSPPPRQRCLHIGAAVPCNHAMQPAGHDETARCRERQHSTEMLFKPQPPHHHPPPPRYHSAHP